MNPFRIVRQIGAQQCPIPSPYSRLVRSLDGSVTKMIEAITGQQVSVTSVSTNVYSQQQIENISSLAPLQFCHTGDLMQRMVELSTVDSNRNKWVWVYGRSLYMNIQSSWAESRYREFTEGVEQMPLGCIIIDKRVVSYKQVQWTGLCDLLIGQQMLQQVESRSYLSWQLNYKAGKRQYTPFFQLEEYFTDQFMRLLSSKE